MADSSTIWLPMLPIVQEHLIANVILGFFALSVTGLRLYSRTMSIGFGWDDAWILGGALLAIVLICQQGAYSTIGEGYDFDPSAWYYPALLQNLPTLLKITFSFQLLYMNSLTCIKFSILCFYKRVFGTNQVIGTERVIHATMALVVIWSLGVQLTEVFACHPVQYWWDQTIPGGYCINQVPIYTALIIVNIITDVLIMALPMVPIWRLQMRMAEKLALMAAFGLGIGSIVVGIVRLVTVFAVDMQNNVTGSIELAVFLCTLESLLALVCVNIPMLRPLYRRFVTRTGSSKIYESGQEGRSFQNSKMGTSSKATKADQSASRDVPPHGVGKPAPGWELNEYNTAYAENDSMDDGDSEKGLTKDHGVSKRSKSGQIKVETEWEITRK